MAEVRKFKPGQGNQISEAIARAMGESVRPATPGASPEPGRKQPPQAAAPNITSFSATTFGTSDPFLVTRKTQPPSQKSGSQKSGSQKSESQKSESQKSEDDE